MSSLVSTSGLEAIYWCCNQAYRRDLLPLFKTFNDPTHVLGYNSNSFVSHAMWVTRWLQPGDGTSLRTAYVEMVATDPEYQGRGFATKIIRRLMEEILHQQAFYSFSSCGLMAAVHKA